MRTLQGFPQAVPRFVLALGLLWAWLMVPSALALILTGVIFVPLLLVKLLAGKTPVAE